MHENKINGKKYIGITCQDIEKRWENGKGYSDRLVFGKAINKYGWDGFRHVVLMRNLKKEEANCMERYMIQLLRTNDITYGYNMTSGGDGVCGFKHTEDAKKRMSISHSGEKHINYGKHLSEETRSKISNKLIGNKNFLNHTHTKESIKKTADSKKKPVSMIKDCVVIKTFASAKDAQEETGISRKNISLCCLGKRPHAGGYAWKFA